jgi:predicted HAD superfamily Cof-like phosphohydrolase
VARYFEDIAQFHERFAISYKGPPRLLPRELYAFRHKFLFEETCEYKAACEEKNLEEVLDSLVDLMYILVGTAYLHGFAHVFDTAWQRVHDANMRKIRATPDNAGKRDAPQFDVVKPIDWERPILKDLVS